MRTVMRLLAGLVAVLVLLAAGYGVAAGVGAASRSTADGGRRR
ncbi:hypothetical protein AB5I41_27360 [Sphingomonas sp. MMS24-JH45]